MSWFAQIVLVVLALLYVLGLLIFLLGLFLPRSGPSSRQLRTVSVIIAARNEEDNIGAVLQDLVHQTYPKELLEVIVVNDGSSDGTAAVVERFAQEYDFVRLLHAEDGPSWMAPKKFALETGVRAARGELILVTDADCRVPSTWVETMVGYFDDETGMVVGFSQIGRRGQRYPLLEGLQALDFLSLMGAAAGSCQVGFPLAGSGQNLAYRKEAFLQVGGYSQVGHRVSGDDVLLLQLVRRQTGWRIRFAFDRRSRVSTRAERSLGALLNQRRRWASNGVYQYFLNRPFFVYAVVTFLLNAGLLLGFLLGLVFGGVGFVGRVFLVKAIAELCLVLRSSQLFDRGDLLRFFPLWVFLQVPYVVVVGLGGTFGNFTWKGRPFGPALADRVMDARDGEEPSENSDAVSSTRSQ